MRHVSCILHNLSFIEDRKEKYLTLHACIKISLLWISGVLRCAIALEKGFERAQMKRETQMEGRERFFSSSSSIFDRHH